MSDRTLMDCAQAALMHSEEDARVIADAAEEIARFRAENIHLRRAGMDRPAELRAEIARLRARVEVLERDASRYQWLKNRKWMSLQTSYMKWIRKDSTSFIASHDLAADGTQYAPYETLDETIDAAMKEAKP